ncbi:hypothetical protein, partial [Lentibacillus halophilus]
VFRLPASDIQLSYWLFCSVFKEQLMINVLISINFLIVTNNQFQVNNFLRIILFDLFVEKRLNNYII